MTMRIMMLYKTGSEIDRPPPQEMDGMEMTGEIPKTGVLIATDGLEPRSNGTRVRISGKKFIVTDGPFAETKELIAG